MRYPLALCSHNRVVIAPQEWFDGIGHLDEKSFTLRLNVNRLGAGGLKWFIDADGKFYELNWRGVEAKSTLQKLGLLRPVETYAISPPREITLGELAALAAELEDRFSEAPNSADLRALAQSDASSETLSRGMMLGYFGE
jgi:hypothetical protein